MTILNCMEIGHIVSEVLREAEAGSHTHTHTNTQTNKFVTPLVLSINVSVGTTRL